jgi:outer membrane protein insertion porin family
MLNLRVLSWLFITLSLLLAGAARSQTETPGELRSRQYPIGSIRIVGNVSIKTENILSKVYSRVGDLFDVARADKDVERIAELIGVDSARYDTSIVDNKIVLTFVVVEKDIVRSIEFVGNERIRAKILRRRLGFMIRDYLDLISAESGRTALEELYLKRGFAFVQVTLDIEQLRKGRLIYRIDEGPRVRIHSARFGGNKAVKTGTLKRAAKTDGRKWFFWPRDYTKKAVDKDLARLQKLYYKRGFLDSSITVKREFNAKRTKARLTFVIDEGPVYTVGRVVVTGMRRLAEEQIRAELKLEEGQIYSEKRANSDVKRVLTLYREAGFIDTEVERRRRFVSKDKVNVEFEITEGERFRIGRIDVTGNKQTQDEVVRRVLDEYDFLPGKWYNADIARGDGSGELEKEVRRRVLAEEATIKPSGEVPGQRNAEVNIEEGKTGSWMIGGGVSSDSGVIGHMILQQRNFDITDWPGSFGEFITGKAFRGKGQIMRISLEPGTELSQYSISFTEPYFRNKPIELGVTGMSWERERESYDEGRLKGYVGFAQRYQKRYRDRWLKSIGLRFENVDVGSLDNDAPKEIIDDKGDNALVGVLLGVKKDLTDDRFNPGKGYIFSTNYEQVGGEHTFGILSATHRRYSTLYEDLAGRRTILATKLHASTILGDAPSFEKFYAGGSGFHGIRGFDYRGVSTRGLPTVGGVPVDGAEKKDPIGSDWIFLASGEVVVPLVGEEFAALFFVDSGAIDSGNYRAAAGTGIQILIPQWFGPVPMRFEIAAPLMKDDEDDTQAFSFSVGGLF